MSKEKIIDVFIKNSDCPNGTHRTLNKYQQNKVADELFAEFEQEKKEQAREIFEKIYNEIEYYSLGQIAIRQLAKEYGVEL